ncbi:MAG: type II secretion system GspH family protein [Candidatus Muirbacterium halophilum]|nr:type II secretion system GspH family protein [Candidatus Muirbacterium halophilum]MCK9476848.1 type II secretion system GspH family protein [Candidatus Muirbacterium halophilum]
MKKKALTLVEILIVVAISGVLILALYSFSSKSQKITHYKGIKSEMQTGARIFIENFFIDIQSAYKVRISGSDLEVELFKEIPSNSELKYTPETEIVSYEFNKEDRIVVRTHRNKKKSFYHVKEIEFKYLGIQAQDKIFKVVEASDSGKAVGVTLRMHFSKKGDDDKEDAETFNVLTSAFIKTQNALLRFGTQGPIKYGYFSSLEDSSF